MGQKLGKRKEQIIQIFITVFGFTAAAFILVLLLPVAAISYVYTQLKIKLRTLRKKLKDIL